MEYILKTFNNENHEELISFKYVCNVPYRIKILVQACITLK